VRDISLILLAAGNSTRFSMPVKKQWLYQGNRPLWLKVADDFSKAFDFSEIIITGTPGEIGYMSLFGDYTFVKGGDERQASLLNALEAVSTEYVPVNDIARCCLDTEMIGRILKHAGKASCIAPAIKAVDTVYFGDSPVDREAVRMIQTPQLSKSDILRKALKGGRFTDESSAIGAMGESVMLVEGSAKAHKLTHPQDLRRLPCLEPPSADIFTGFGIDTHAFEKNRRMKLGGIFIDVPFGLRAHSDGDVAIHALIDAILGAAGMGDIGELFPDTDPLYADSDSMKLLDTVLIDIRARGFELLHTDLTILAETPRLAPYKSAIRRNLSSALGLPPQKVNIKATTSEKMGFIGRKEGITVHAVATMRYFDWRQS